MHKFNVAIIGMGKIGKIRYEVFRQNKKINDIIFFDKYLKKYKDNISEKDYKSILINKEIDIVCICTPNKFLKKYLLLALSYGKNVLCEKPPGINLEETYEIYKKIIKLKKIKLMFGFNHRYLKNFLFLKDMLSNHSIFDINWIKATYIKSYDKDFADQWRSSSNLSGGGILLDQGIHMLDLLQILFGNLKVLSSKRYFNKKFGKNFDENNFITLENKYKTPIFFHSSINSSKHKFEIEVSLNKKIYLMKGIKSSTRSYGDETFIVYHKENSKLKLKIKKFNVNDFYTFKNETNYFIKTIASKQDIDSGSIYDALNLMKLYNKINATT